MAKVLVIDDSETMRMIIKKGVKRAAEASGKPAPIFVEATDGLEALAAIEKDEDIYLAFCDMNMPNMNGIDFVRAVRDSDTTSRVDIGRKSIIKRTKNTLPIIMVTTESALEIVKEVLEAGANDYIKKPFTPQQFTDKVSAYLE